MELPIFSIILLTNIYTENIPDQILQENNLTINKKKKELSNNISNNGFIYGFVSILIIVIINAIIIFTVTDKKFLNTRINIIFDTSWLFILVLYQFIC